MPAHLLQLPESLPRVQPGACYFGQLTDRGKTAMVTLGSRLRAIYGQYLGLLPPTWGPEAASALYLRSTNYPRTLETLQHVLAGLYPGAANQGDPTASVKTPFLIHTRPEDMENMYPWSKCARMRLLQKHFKTTVHSLLAKDIEHLQASLRHLLALPDSYGAFPSFHGIYDVLSSAKAHGHDIEAEYRVPSSELVRLERLVAREWFYGLEKSSEMVRLGIGRFLRDLLFAFREKLAVLEPPSLLSDLLPPDPPTGLRQLPSPLYPGMETLRLLLFSGHDSTIAPVLIALGAYDGLWPQFGANLSLELIQDTAWPSSSAQASGPSAGHVHPTMGTNSVDAVDGLDGSRSVSSVSADAFFVRLKANDRVLSMRDCVEHRHPQDGSLCQLKHFFDICSRLIPKDLDQECAVPTEL